MQPASHRDSHTRPDSAQTQHTTSIANYLHLHYIYIATKRAPYTRHISTSALAQQSQHLRLCTFGCCYGSCRHRGVSRPSKSVIMSASNTPLKFVITLAVDRLRPTRHARDWSLLHVHRLSLLLPHVAFQHVPVHACTGEGVAAGAGNAGPRSFELRSRLPLESSCRP